jgi:GDP-4-dehydro-6-deoxy-D-mannose reductase
MDKKLLITGISGFVAAHFVEYLYNNHPEYGVIGLDLSKPKFDYGQFKDKLNIQLFEANLLDTERLATLFQEIKPDYVLHLAAFSSVAYSWQHPSESFINNSNIFLNLINALDKANSKCKVLSVGSSEEYGNVGHENIPIRENQPVNPLSPYAVARVSQELLSKVFVKAFSMDIVLTRSFNHIGPRQDQRFVVPSFINKILDIKDSGKTEGIIETGNLHIIRDFVDVRDVVRAYYLLLTKGKSGEIYNICSGHGIKLSDLIKIIADDVGVTVKTVTNPDFIRPDDNMEIVGSNYKLEAELGWKPTIELKDTIHDMILYYQQQRTK